MLRWLLPESIEDNCDEEGELDAVVVEPKTHVIF